MLCSPSESGLFSHQDLDLAPFPGLSCPAFYPRTGISFPMDNSG